MPGHIGGCKKGASKGPPPKTSREIDQGRGLCGTPGGFRNISRAGSKRGLISSARCAARRASSVRPDRARIVARAYGLRGSDPSADSARIKACSASSVRPVELSTKPRLYQARAWAGSSRTAACRPAMVFSVWPSSFQASASLYWNSARRGSRRQAACSQTVD